MAPSVLARLCIPEQGPATGRLVRDLFGLHRIIQRGTSGSEYQLFTLPTGIEVLVLAQHGHQVPLVPDQGSVQQFSRAAADPAVYD
jgi:hypothetical protein